MKTTFSSLFTINISLMVKLKPRLDLLTWLCIIDYLGSKWTSITREKELRSSFVCCSKRKERKEKEKKRKTKENIRKIKGKSKGNLERNSRAAKGRGSRQPRRGKRRSTAAVEGGGSGGAATVRSHGSPPSPSCCYAVGKLPDLPFRISFNLDLKNSF